MTLHVNNRLKIILLLILLSLSGLSCSQNTSNTNTNQKQAKTDESSINEQTIFNIKGIWKSQCSNEVPSIEFFDENSATMDFNTKSGLLARINLSIKKNGSNFIINFDGLTGVTKGNPDLEWVNFSREETIAEIKEINENTVEINWLGFYNQKSKKRNSTENPFSKENNSIVGLIKCSE